MNTKEYEIWLTLLEDGEWLVNVSTYPTTLLNESAFSIDKLLADARNCIVDHQNNEILARGWTS